MNLEELRELCESCINRVGFDGDMDNKFTQAVTPELVLKFLAVIKAGEEVVDSIDTERELRSGKRARKRYPHILNEELRQALAAVSLGT